jgi:hypothetical protein
MDLDILDRLSPTEADLPPSERVWARMIVVDAMDVLEIRDPNDGQGSDPADKTRHQYAVARGALWRRRLPPAPLDRQQDDTPWADDPDASAWHLVPPSSTRRGIFAAPNPNALPWLWAMGRGVQPYPIEPIREAESYLMPPGHPYDIWADITGVPCPVDGCHGTLGWAEAGQVPGYRVCDAGHRFYSRGEGGVSVLWRHW